MSVAIVAIRVAREPGSLLFFQTVEMVVSKVKEGTPRLIEAHQQLVDALRRRDKAAARLWMTRHSNDWRRGFERAGNSLDEPVDRIYAEHITDGQGEPG